MKVFLKRLSIVFSAAALGGLTNSIAVWLFGAIGITSAFGVAIAPSITPQWLYPRLVWGGIWGILFMLPLLKDRHLQRGILFSLGPSIVQLFIVFPFKAGKGMMGLELGLLTPVFVLIFNGVWGITAALWLRYIDKE